MNGEVEADEVYIVAGHKGHPDLVAHLGRESRCQRLKGKRGRGTLADEKPPILGLLQRTSEVMIRMLPTVQQVTIKPLLTQAIQAGSLLYTDEYDIYTRLEELGYQHKTANHSAGEYARDADGDGFHEVHVNILEASGQCCVHGCGPSATFRTRNCRCIWASLNSCTTRAVVERRC